MDYKGDHLNSPVTRANGTTIVQFSFPPNKRHTIQLGNIEVGDALIIKGHIEELICSSKSGLSVDPETKSWLRKLRGRELYNKLADTGLVPQLKANSTPTLRDFIDGYIKRRTDVKPRTLKKYNSTRNSLCAYFGADKPIDQITPGDAEGAIWSVPKK